MSGFSDNRPWSIHHAVVAILAALTASVIAAVIVGPEISDQETFRVILPTQILVQIGVVAWFAVRSRRRMASLGLRYGEGDAIGLAVGVGLQFAATLVLLPIVIWVLDGEVPTQEVVDSAAALRGFDMAMVVLWAGVVGPLAEELVFRGVLLRALIVVRGPRFSTYVTAAAFAALHLLDPNAWLVVPVLFAVGVVLARQAISTGRLARPFLTHAAFNLIAVGSLFVSG